MFLIISNSFCKNSKGTPAPKKGEGHRTSLLQAGLKQVIKAHGPHVFSLLSQFPLFILLGILTAQDECI